MRGRNSTILLGLITWLLWPTFEMPVRAQARHGTGDVYHKPAPYPVVVGNAFDRSDWLVRGAPTRHRYFGDMTAGLHTNKNVPPARSLTRRGVGVGSGGLGGGRVTGGAPQRPPGPLRANPYR
jgi:hypothetical protein